MIKQMERKNISIELYEIKKVLFDGMYLAIGGYLTENKPMSIIKEIIKSGIKDLTVISLPCGVDLDLLIAAGCVRTVICPYVGMESLSPIAPFFRQKSQRGEIRVKEVDVSMVVLMLRSAALNLPFLPWKGGIGTSLPELNPDLKIIQNPFGNDELIAVPAFYPDLAIVHAAQADIYGNVQHKGKAFIDGLIARASKKTIVQVEKIVPNDEIKLHFLDTTIPAFLVNGLIYAPNGAHPLSSQKYYGMDGDFIKKYIDVSAKYINNESNEFEDFFQKYIYRNNPGSSEA